MFVIQRHDGAFVMSNSNKSYTRSLTEAKTFLKRESAEKERCGNETIVPVEQLLERPVDEFVSW